MVESGDRRPVRTPPHPLETLVGTKAWVAILPLVLLVALETRGESPLFTPYSTVVGAGIFGLLVYQAGFLVYSRHHAAEQGVYFPERDRE